MNHSYPYAHPNAPRKIGPGMYLYGLPSKSRGIYVLLGLFLGFLGVHDFYAGRIRWGVSHLLYTILFGWLIFPQLLLALVILVELCVVDRDGAGYPMQ